MSTTIQGANGVLTLPGAWRGLLPELQVTGGPYRYRPAGLFGVCLLEREPKSCDVWLPIEDFSVPAVPPAEVEAKVKLTLQALLDGKQVYAGCMGGWGRTGLFLSLVAKACGVADPVAYVRRVYSRRAVETAEQEQWVADFDVTRLRRWLLFASAKRWLRRLVGF